MCLETESEKVCHALGVAWKPGLGTGDRGGDRGHTCAVAGEAWARGGGRVSMRPQGRWVVGRARQAVGEPWPGRLGPAGGPSSQGVVAVISDRERVGRG